LRPSEARPRWVGIIVDTGCVDVENLAPKHLLGRTDVTDAGKQFIEVIHQTLATLTSLVVEGEAFDNAFAQPCRGPLAEAGCDNGFYPITHRDDHIQIVKIHQAADLSVSLGLNYPEFPDS